MLVKFTSVAVLMASMAIGAPLNINLGAYSPALVVGDGEISFAGNGGGEAGAAAIVNTLQGASQAGGQAAAQGAAIPAQGQQPAAAPATQATQANQVQGLARSSVLSEPASLPVPGLSKRMVPRQANEDEEEEEPVKREEGSLMKRQNGFDRALQFAEVALTKGPKVQLGTEAAGVGILVENQPATGGTAKGAAAPAAAAGAAAPAAAA